MKRNTPHITGITLAGFQVFDKPTHIPLSNLTLSYGPNSAGKSSVKDAIEIFRILLCDQKKPYPQLELAELFKRHWRRNQNGREEQFAKEMSFRLFHFTQVENLPPLQVESIWRFQDFEASYIEGDTVFKHFYFELYVNSDLVLRHNSESLSFNPKHFIFIDHPTSMDFAKIAKKYPEAISSGDGFITITRLESPLFILRERAQNLYELRSGKKSPFSTALEALNVAFKKTFKDIFQPVSDHFYLHAQLNASRGIPTRSDLTYTFDPFTINRQMALSEHQGDPKYRRLLESLVSDRLDGVFDGAIHTGSDYFATHINRMLSDHLFIEQGYQLDYDFRVILSKENSVHLIKSLLDKPLGTLNATGMAYQVELFLRDASGRQHYFEDVGSGIGYLLSVLCALDERNNFCFVQQPELHIHPALQSALGDVFIESSKIGFQQLIETHSEHLLLRILKRIRQTHKQVSIAEELKISADDVCVLYFDPSPDGTTTVKRLRITEDGEFMDRWPRGFFTERDQDLFDE